MAKDNRRRIKQDVLDEIEKHDGGNFTEKLLNWKHEQDNLSQSDIETTINAQLESFFSNRTDMKIY